MTRIFYKTQRNQKPLYTGFTLIEMMVAVSLFSVVSLIVVGTVLVLINGNAQNQTEQQVLGGLTVALDTMTREIRSGTHYYCTTSPDNSHGTNVSDCRNGSSGISFRESVRRLTTGRAYDRVAFFFDVDDGRIMRKIATDDAEPITPSNIDIISLQFVVTGTDTLEEGDTEQSTVTIVIRAQDNTGFNDKEFTIQSTVTQRILDL